MNNVAILPQLIMQFLQRQNVKRNIIGNSQERVCATNNNDIDTKNVVLDAKNVLDTKNVVLDTKNVVLDANGTTNIDDIKINVNDILKN